MPGKAPHLKNKVKSLLHRQEALSLVSQGWPITKISEHMGIAVQSVRRHLRQALTTESLYPNQLTPERVAELRVLEAERLAVSTQKVVVAQNNALRRLKADNPKVAADAEMSIYRAHEALTRSCERLARLFGLDAPTKTITGMLIGSCQSQKWELGFDRSPIGALARQPVPELSVTVGSSLSGNGEIADELPNTPTNDFTDNGTKQPNDTDAIPVAS
jgi:hypothetical protein